MNYFGLNFKNFHRGIAVKVELFRKRFCHTWRFQDYSDLRCYWDIRNHRKERLTKMNYLWKTIEFLGIISASQTVSTASFFQSPRATIIVISFRLWCIIFVKVAAGRWQSTSISASQPRHWCVFRNSVIRRSSTNLKKSKAVKASRQNPYACFF